MTRTIASNVSSPFTGGRVFLVEDIEEQEFRKEKYGVHVRYYVCEDTGEQFTTTEQDEMAFNELYNQYRVRHGIPFPDEIRRTRERYGLSCAQMTRIVGFGQNQWRLYEAGQVPTESNGKSIVAVADSGTLLRMLEASRAEFPEDEYLRIRRKAIMAGGQDDDRMARLYFYGDTKRGMYNGYSAMSPAKLGAMVRLIVHNEGSGVAKTKLNKEMFYSDFLHYKRHGQSISGLCYQAIQYGPVPFHYDTIYDNVKDLQREEVTAGDLDYVLFKAAKPDISVLDDKEVATIMEVSRRLAPMSRKEVVTLVHKETAWQQYKDKHQLIPYSEAFNILAFQ